MFSGILTFVRNLTSRDTGGQAVVVGEEPDPAAYPVIVIDFAAEGSPHPVANAALTCVDPGRVLAVAAFLERRSLEPGAWLLCGLGTLPYSPESASDFVVELCHRAGCSVFVDAISLPGRTPERFVAHLRRSAAELRHRSLSAPVRVLFSGHNSSEHRRDFSDGETNPPTRRRANP